MYEDGVHAVRIFHYYVRKSFEQQKKNKRGKNTQTTGEFNTFAICALLYAGILIVSVSENFLFLKLNDILSIYVLYNVFHARQLRYIKFVLLCLPNA